MHSTCGPELLRHRNPNFTAPSRHFTETAATMGRRCRSLALLLLVSQVVAWQHATSAELRLALGERVQTLVAYREHSRSLEPEWALVRDAAQDANIMSIDCATEVAVCSELDVVTFPAIRLYHGDGRITRYRGPRKSTPMLDFLRRTSRPIVSEIASSATSFSDFTYSDDITFTAEFLPEEASLYEWQYRDLARQYHDRYSFAILPPSQHQSVVRCRNSLNDEDFTLKELWLVGALDELVSQCTAPLVLEPTRREIAELGQMAAQAGRHMIVHYFATSDSEKHVYREEVKPLAKKYSSDLLFTIIDTQEHPLMPAMVGLGTGTGISIENLRTGHLFPYPEGESSATRLEKFLLDVINGAVPPWDGLRAEVAHDEL
ncbi:hypothetical protein B0H67DRAFT_569813 [Lasiosphaeris hirsuta]|uniref:Thioredoxin domain-containing protein n=1 Tax=Lasiosphaeris hirsuta TaxID=260670 RepID=A0AA40B084_9PEZI|nr:hypothetical protein B0H67DRAFT_569813 [Lasiosphaeris hirsuta]